MADMPDLSHLTQEERAIIENVMQRQRQEEERENEIMRYVLNGWNLNVKTFHSFSCFGTIEHTFSLHSLYK